MALSGLASTHSSHFLAEALIQSGIQGRHGQSSQSAPSCILSPALELKHEHAPNIAAPSGPRQRRDRWHQGSQCSLPHSDQSPLLWREPYSHILNWKHRKDAGREL
ncbi:hypothetical protein AAFF_G00437670 [Aldrovandia affinis]|uniref:Uncharacterized protein n=1 Tax=Aldrovandia affinis TaxID=143900 RepID=A0AAD7S9Z1_9TELE|nr:hypothetical protein AAFF_G00437670 [Aldrovandia affinis]